MKKWIIAVIIVGMVGWAIYDFVLAEKTEMQAEVGIEIDDIAPDFSLMTLDGETVKLSDYRGKKVMVNFWATWCPPCRAEMPDLQKLYDDTDIEVLAVNLTATESTIEGVEEFVKDEFGLTFPVALDEEGEVEQMYEIVAYPTSFLIDSEGVIQKIALGALNYEQMLEQFNKFD